MSDIICNNGYAYPSPAVFVQAGCQMQAQSGIENDLLLKFLPFRREPMADMIVFQYTNIFCGLQQYRGLGNALPNANLEEAMTECAVRPSYWGEEAGVSEVDLTRRAVRTGNGCNTPVDITDLLGFRQKWLMVRRNNRIKKLVADALVFGTYEVVEQNTGAVIQRQKYNINETTSLIPWSDPVNSTPLLDLLNWRNYYEQRTFSKFGSCAKLVMNRNTFTKFMRNTNPANWRTLLGEYCCQGKSLDQINALLEAHDLPQIEIYNETYFDCELTRGPIMSNQLAPKKFFLPDDYAVIVGCCEDSGNRVGNFWFTRNVNTCGNTPDAGPVELVNDYCDKPPRRITVGSYWNGGPAIEIPKAIISARVG